MKLKLLAMVLCLLVVGCEPYKADPRETDSQSKAPCFCLHWCWGHVDIDKCGHYHDGSKP